LDAEINRQASAIAYVDDFVLMMWIIVFSAPLLLLLKHRKRETPPADPAMALE
jgi:hypothetical protein